MFRQSHGSLERSFHFLHTNVKSEADISAIWRRSPLSCPVLVDISLRTQTRAAPGTPRAPTPQHHFVAEGFEDTATTEEGAPLEV